MSTLSVIFHAIVVGGTLRGSIEGNPMWMDEAELHDKLFKQQTNILERYLARQHEKVSDTIPPPS